LLKLKIQKETFIDAIKIGALHENADLRVKALEKLYSLLKEKCSEIIYLIQRQENSQIISEIVLALLNGCRDSDPRAKLL